MLMMSAILKSFPWKPPHLIRLLSRSGRGNVASLKIRLDVVSGAYSHTVRGSRRDVTEGSLVRL